MKIFIVSMSGALIGALLESAGMSSYPAYFLLGSATVAVAIS